MEQRRFILFITLSMAVLIGWLNFGPLVFPGLFPPPNNDKVAQQDPAEELPADGQDPDGDDGPAIARHAEPEGDAEPPDAEPPAVQPPASAFEEGAPLTLELGSSDPSTGYYLSVKLTSEGAAIEEVALNDRRYRDLALRDQPLKVLTTDPDGIRTLQTSVPPLEEHLAEHAGRLDEIHWHVDTSNDPESGQPRTVRDPRFPDQEIYSQVTFTTTIPTPTGPVAVYKRYSLPQPEAGEADSYEIRDTVATHYLLDFELTFHNTGDQAQLLQYRLQGPVGVPLENEENTRTFRALKMGFLDPETGEVLSSSLVAENVAEADAEDEIQRWKKPIRYIGVDVQYFAALLVPDEDQAQRPYFEYAEPHLVSAAANPSHSDISVRLTSEEIQLAPGEQQSFAFTLFAGPKREALLSDSRLEASDVLEYGWFGWVAKMMLGLLKFLHDTGMPYGLAIITMTILVRACMFPISRKQAQGAKKMKELQPKIQELRQKYAKDKEKLARAQMELFSKHNYNPLAGCLPLFLQLPIFIGLYTALNNAVDLRMAEFLWIDNLAAPDALFQFPFALPFLGQSFNLLPIITVFLFIAQQKMFTPPAADKEQEMQFKMMNYMMIVFGFLFYHVPAGLCVYFIASSMWGMGERKMLDFGGMPAFSKRDEDDEQKNRSEVPPAPKADSGGNGAPANEMRARRKARRQSQSGN